MPSTSDRSRDVHPARAGHPGPIGSAQLSINGTVVGPVTIFPGTSTVSRTYSFGAITGPTYTIHLQTIRTVNSGCGAADIPEGVSTLRIRG